MHVNCASCKGVSSCAHPETVEQETWMTPSRTAQTPEPAYVAGVGSPLAADPAVYGPIASALDRRTLVDELVVPVRSGRAWTVPAGHVCRLSIVEGPQVFDLNV